MALLLLWLLLGLLLALGGEILSELVLLFVARWGALEAWREGVLVDEEFGEVVVEAGWGRWFGLLALVRLRLFLTLLKLVRLGSMVEEAGRWYARGGLMG